MSRPTVPISAGTAGLRAICEHLRVQASKTSVFVRCGLAEVDARFAKYPPAAGAGLRGVSGGADSLIRILPEITRASSAQQMW